MGSRVAACRMLPGYKGSDMSHVECDFPGAWENWNNFGWMPFLTWSMTHMGDSRTETQVK